MDIEQKIQLYKEILNRSNLTMKGKNNLYTSLNGNMFSFVGKQDIVAIRLSKEDQKTFLETYKTEFPVKQYGANMHGYVEVPDELLVDIEEATSWWKRSIKYTESLPKK